MKRLQELAPHPIQPLLRDNTVQIGCRLQFRGNGILNKLHKCPVICCFPPRPPVLVNVYMLCGLAMSVYQFHWVLFQCATATIHCLFVFFQIYTQYKNKNLQTNKKSWMLHELSAVLNPDLFAVYYLESLKNHKVTVSAKKALNVSSFFKFLRLSFY